MNQRLKTLAKATLMLLTVALLFNFYQLSFDIWMTAYPFANHAQWRGRAFIHLLIAILLVVIWGVLAVWLLRHRRASKNAGV